MRHRHPYENRYCNGCKQTTSHEVKATVYACLRCGTLKYPTKVVVVIHRPVFAAAGE